MKPIVICAIKQGRHVFIGGTPILRIVSEAPAKSGGTFFWMFFAPDTAAREICFPQKNTRGEPRRIARA